MRKAMTSVIQMISVIRILIYEERTAIFHSVDGLHYLRLREGSETMVNPNPVKHSKDWIPSDLLLRRDPTVVFFC